MSKSIRYMYQSREFFDLGELTKSDERIDVICPVIHSTDLWKENLYSWYKEIPIANLLIGDGGCVDETIEILKDFPRVKILDHKNYRTLGKSLAILINSVETDYFIYLQSDVFLPEKWFSQMSKKKQDYDWFGCPANLMYILEKRSEQNNRPFAGSQMGLKKAFNGIEEYIKDDFIYRQEDLVLEQFVIKSGFRTGKITDTEHFHQVMTRNSLGEDLKNLSLSVTHSRKSEEEKRVRHTQFFGLIKYCDPIDKNILDAVTGAYYYLLKNKGISIHGAFSFVITNNSLWSKYLIKITLKYLLHFYFIKRRF